MYTFCLFVVFLALFLTAFNSQCIEAQSRETITSLEIKNQFFFFIEKVKAFLLSLTDFKTKPQSVDSTVTLSEQNESIAVASNPATEPQLPTPSVA